MIRNKFFRHVHKKLRDHLGKFIYFVGKDLYMNAC